MVVGLCSVLLRIPTNRSLKGKRRVLRAIVARVRRDFNVSIAEVGQQDSWQAATLGIACVSSDAGYAHGLLSRVVESISGYRLDAEVIDYSIEIC
jgi:uncharacterized protein YlxP (DUF503 family)